MTDKNPPPHYCTRCGFEAKEINDAIRHYNSTKGDHSDFVVTPTD